jgi:hypothetical protein
MNLEHTFGTLNDFNKKVQLHSYSCIENYNFGIGHVSTSEVI